MIFAVFDAEIIVDGDEIVRIIIFFQNMAHGMSYIRSSWESSANESILIPLTKVDSRGFMECKIYLWMQYRLLHVQVVTNASGVWILFMIVRPPWWPRSETLKSKFNRWEAIGLVGWSGVLYSWGSAAAELPDISLLKDRTATVLDLILSTHYYQNGENESWLGTSSTGK